jgi:CBS domain-containing protein
LGVGLILSAETGCLPLGSNASRNDSAKQDTVFLRIQCMGKSNRLRSGGQKPKTGETVMPSRKISQVIGNQKIVTAAPSLSVLEATRLMAQAHVGSIMITEGERLVGIFTERDALNRVLAAGLDPTRTPLSAVMTANPQAVSADALLGHALHQMFERGFRHMPVVEDGRPIGMVSSRDALGPEMAAFEAEVERRNDISELL